MSIIKVQLAMAVRRSFRVEQVAGMFDVPIEERVKHELTAEVPGLDEKWTIGAIVGPSGSGKTTLAKAAFGDFNYRRRAWPKNKAIIDCLGDASIKALTFGLTCVGLGSPPTWLKPYRLLSTGEKFRVDLLKSLLTVLPDQAVVVDEFSAALDRTVAKTTSAAVARYVRMLPDELRARLVAVTCHHDVLPWLQPDWVVQLGRSTAGQASSATHLIRGRWKRPRLRWGWAPVPQALWSRFAPFHYLGGGLAASATCYAAFWNKEPIAFCAIVAALGWPGVKRIQRLVTLPEFQGMGIGGKLLDVVAATQARAGFRVTITASHPAIIAHCSRSKQWQYFGIKKTGSTRQQFEGREVRSSVGRAVAAFEYIGPKSEVQGPKSGN
jgi:GNAT superfamily N-acetyltransferase